MAAPHDRHLVTVPPRQGLGRALGAYSGHAAGDSKGQQRFAAGSGALALASGEGSEQQRSRGHAVHGMQGVRVNHGRAADLGPVSKAHIGGELHRAAVGGGEPHHRTIGGGRGVVVPGRRLLFCAHHGALGPCPALEQLSGGAQLRDQPEPQDRDAIGGQDHAPGGHAQRVPDQRKQNGACDQQSRKQASTGASRSPRYGHCSPSVPPPGWLGCSA